MPAEKRYCVVKLCENNLGTTDKNTQMFKFPSNPTLQSKWYEAIRGANNCECSTNGFVCSLHFAEENFDTIDGKVHLKKGAIPTEFWVDINYEFEDEIEHDDDQEFSKSQLQVKYDQLLELHLENQLDFNIREAALLKKNQDLEQTVKSQANELSALKKAFTSSQKLIQDMEYELVEAKTQTNIGSQQQKIKQVIYCLVNGVQHREKYPEAVRDFCLMVHYASVRAYEAIREYFGNTLPHPGTLRAWYSNSDLNCEPGISVSCLNILKRKAEMKKAAGQELVVSLIFDEMHTRKMFQWCNSSRTMLGYSTFGSNLDENGKNTNPAANQVIVLMAIGVNENIKLPFAYHFIKSLKAEERQQLIGQAIDALIDAGVKVACITFDGLVANRKMCKLFGANIDIFSPQFNPCFNAKNGNKIHIMLDTPHMEKLVRGALGQLKVFYTSANEKIEWKHYEELVKFDKRGFGLTHKLNQNHINYTQRKMKVNLAVQLFSKSTADSLEFLKNEGYIDFRNAASTIYWTRLMNDLFDILNSKTDQHDEKFKKAICAETKDDVFALFDRATNFIKNLKLRAETGEVKKLVNSDLRVGFRGLIINMFSVKSMYKEYVEERKILTCLPTYPLNQDAVEIFFSKVRSLNGQNDNPSSQQFQSAYRKLLVHSTVCTSKLANNYNFDIASEPFSNILFVTSRRVNIIDPAADENEPLPEELEEVLKNLAEIEEIEKSSYVDTGLSELTIAHISSIIENRINRPDRMYCDGCRNVFNENDRIQRAFTSLKFKNKPCVSTFAICKEADRFIKMQLLNGSMNFTSIYYAIFQQIDFENLFAQTDFSHKPDHKLALIRGIIDSYIQIKGTYIAKKANFEMHPNQLRIRLKKLLHVFGQ